MSYLKEYYVDPPRHPMPPRKRSQMPRVRVSHDAGNKKNRLHQGLQLHQRSHEDGWHMGNEEILNGDFIDGGQLAEQPNVVRRTQAKCHYIHIREINDSIAYRHSPNGGRRYDEKEQMPACGLYHELDTSGETDDKLRKCLLWTDDDRYALYYLIQKRSTDIKRILILYGPSRI